MNTLLKALAEDAILRYAFNLAIGAAVVSAIGWLAARTAQRSAALRQGFLAAAIFLLIALPLLIIPNWRGGLIRAADTTGRASDYRAENSPIAAQEEPLSPVPSSVPQGKKASPLPSHALEKAQSASSFPISKVLWSGLILWGLGSAWRLLPMMQSLIRLRRFRSRSAYAAPVWTDRMKQAAEAVGLEPEPRVAFASVPVPFSLGGQHPVILLPESVREIGAKEAEAILLHEAGHLVHRHHSLGLLMTAADVLYWWLPPVWWINTMLADAMEEVCDNHVLQVQGNGRALGRCLLQAAEAMTDGLSVLPGSAILNGRQGLKRRLARVLAGTGSKETTMNRLGRAVTASIVLICLVACALVRVAPVEAEEGRETWARYFPMTVGSEWTYRVTTAGQEKPGEQQRIVRGRIPLKKGGACLEIETILDGQRGGYLYAGLRSDGYYIYPHALPGMLGVNEEAAPTPLAVFPLKAGQSWNWQEPEKRGGASSEAGVGITECRATLEKMDEPVTVPAGKYRALRIRIQRKDSRIGASEERIWYAAGVGMVRQEVWITGQQTPTSVTELTRFLPGTRQAEGAEEMLSLVRRMTAGMTPARTVRAIPLTSGRLLHHYAATRLIVNSGQDDIYRTSGDKIVTFDPLSAADWNRFLAEDGTQQPLIGPDGGISPAQEIGILMAESLGMETDSKTYLDRITTKINPDGGSEIHFSVRGFPGKYATYRLYVWVEVSQTGEITKLSFGPSNDADHFPPASGSPPAREIPSR